LILNDTDETKVLGLLLIPQHDHAIVRVIHLVQLLFSLTRVEVILDDINIVFLTFVKHVELLTLLIRRFSQLLPDVAAILLDNAWSNWVVVDEHTSGKEHVDLLDLLVNDQPFRVFMDTQKNVWLVEAKLHHLLDCLDVS